MFITQIKTNCLLLKSLNIWKCYNKIMRVSTDEEGLQSLWSRRIRDGIELRKCHLEDNYTNYASN